MLEPIHIKKPLTIIIYLIGCIGFSQTEKFTVGNLPLNNEYPHFGLMLVNDSKIIFTSYLLDKKAKLKRYQGHRQLAIFEGYIKKNGAIKNIDIVHDQKINYITSATISSAGKQLYLTTTFNDDVVNKDNFQIKVDEFRNGVGWTNFKTLSFCNPKYSYAHPAMIKDGKTLYFTSNIRGGKETTKGGSDIFKVAILENSIFGEPKNLGSNVNSYNEG